MYRGYKLCINTIGSIRVVTGYKSVLIDTSYDICVFHLKLASYIPLTGYKLIEIPTAYILYTLLLYRVYVLAINLYKLLLQLPL